jgi:uncharacterized delta-60 repeat protein
MFAQFKRLTWKAGLLAALVSLLGFTIALAASGDLDTTFDGDGKVTSYVDPAHPGRMDSSQAIAIQTNGKIVAVGGSYSVVSDFALIRYNPKGSLDATLSGDGRLLTNFGGNDVAYDVAVRSNGKIVVAGETCAGESNCNVALARYNGDGTLDTTFSGDGKQITDIGGGNNGSKGGLAILPSGMIFVAGYVWNGTDYDFAVYRYNGDGSGAGMVNIGFGPGRQDYAQDLVIQADGKIVVIGFSGDANLQNTNFAVARFNPNGSLDPTFSGDGRQTTNLGGDDVAIGVALQADGKIVAAGQKDTFSAGYFALARYNTDGSLDTTFNASGKKAFSFGPGYSFARDVVVQSDGRIVLMGFSENGSNNLEFALARLNSSGSLDTTFSGDGKVMIDFGGNDGGTALALQPSDGKYVLVGNTNDGFQADFALARVLP